MNRNTALVFHGLMKKGWIDRKEDAELWRYTEDSDIIGELEVLNSVIGLDMIPAGDRLYIVPTQDNDLFLKNNIDYRRDIRADNSIRNRDLYLMNYLSIYLLFTFFNGEGNDPLSRNFISKEDFILLFTNHCKLVESTEPIQGENQPDYSDNFKQLASVWMSKTGGAEDSQKIDTRYGVLNRILGKYKQDGLFELNDHNAIVPTRKLKDLMPYFLRRDRIAEINAWIREGQKNAQDH